jgi:hypothetical protein
MVIAYCCHGKWVPKESAVKSGGSDAKKRSLAVDGGALRLEDEAGKSRDRQSVLGRSKVRAARAFRGFS